jgi:TatD DNase family protein
LHWFSGSERQLQRAIEMKCFFSVNGAMCKSANGQKLIHSLPAERILLESDAPFIDEVKTEMLLKVHLNRICDYIKDCFGDEAIALIKEKSAEILSIQ